MKKKHKKKGKGCIFLNKRSGRYYIKIMHQGRSIEKSLKTDDKKLAKQRAKDFVESDLTKFRLNAKGELLKSLWSKFKKSKSRNICSAGTLRNHKRHWQHFLTYCKSKSLLYTSELTTDIITEYFNSLDERGVSTSTYNYYLSSIKLVFKTLIKMQKLTANPLTHIIAKKVVFTSKQKLSIQQLEQLLNYLNQVYDKELITLFYIGIFTGLRQADAINLKWQDINFSEQIINVIPQKTRSYQTKVYIPLFPRLKSYLDTLDKSSLYLCPNLREDYLRTSSITDRVRSIFQEAGFETTTSIPDSNRQRSIIGFHSLRHSLASLLVDYLNINLSELVCILGDSIQTLSKVYININQSTIASLTNGNGAREERLAQAKKFLGII